MRKLLEYSDACLLSMAQSIYAVPSLAAWRAAELKHLRYCRFTAPVLEIGSGDGGFTSLLAPHVDWGVDKNLREVKRCGRRSGTYGHVTCMDARQLAFGDGTFATVFANCVIEHIPELPRALAECRRVLRPGGMLIATVPLREMNRHLLFESAWYARLRARQLEHRNLLSESEWVTALYRAGFSTVETTPYLSGRLCRLWDRVDGPLSIGSGPLRLAQAYSFAVRALPRPWRSGLNRQWQHYFMRALREFPSHPCALLIQARPPAM
jgi:SAM-dependent methyltransferase